MGGTQTIVHTRKFRLCKSAEKNCSETDSYYFGLACRTEIIMIWSGAADFRPISVIRLANTGQKQGGESAIERDFTKIFPAAGGKFFLPAKMLLHCRLIVI